jgi:ATP/maltotriose-dependent transcriptional regulator MalT
LEAKVARSLWYNVDPRDADVANVFHYLTMAAALASPRRKLRLPTFSDKNPAGIGAFARGFFEAFFEQLPRGAAIVFDDYHEVCSEPWDTVVREALAVLPDGVTMVVCSRHEPPRLVARQIAAEALTVLGAADLRLTVKEMSELVRMRRPDLRGARLKAALPHILESANGWAAVLSLLLQDDRMEPFAERGADAAPERLFEYFAAEVLDKASARERDFLLRSSVVPSLSGELAARLTGSVDAPRILADLAKRSFLTQRLGRSGAYRYHPLWRSFLLERAEAELGAASLQDLRRHAAEAFIERGQIDEAMDQLESAKDVSVRVQLILQAAPSFAARGRTHTIATWVERLPATVVEGHGWLSYWQAVSIVAHSPTRARQLLERAFQRFCESDDAAGQYATCGTAIQAIVHEGMDFSRLDAWAQRYGDLQRANVPCPAHVRPTATLGMFMASMFRVRDAVMGRAWADQALRLALDSDDIGYRVMTGGLLALYFVLHDEPSRAEIIVDMLRESARAAEASALPTLTFLMADAIATWVRGDNAKCIELAREALELAERSGVIVWSDYVAALASGETEKAREFVDRLGKAAQSGILFSIGSHAYQLSWEAYALGDRARAMSAGDLANEIAPAIGYPFAEAIVTFGFAQLKWEVGSVSEAKAALATSRRVAEETGCHLVLFGCDLVESDFAWDEDRAHALHCLVRGFGLARERGYHNMFWLGPATLRRVAERALANGVETEFVRALVVKRRLVPERQSADASAWSYRHRVSALGPFEITSFDHAATVRSGSPHGGPRGMPLRLLQAIVAFGGRNVRDVTLIDALWPDADGDAGRRVFDTTLHRLRRQLGESDVLRLTHRTVSLDDRAFWVDLWALDETIASIQSAVTGGAPPGSVAACAEKLLAIYRGPLLEGEPSLLWANAPRRKIAARFRRALEDIAPALERVGAHAAAAALRARARD